MSEAPKMSPATKELLKKVRMIVPPMLEKFHKGGAVVRPVPRVLLNESRSIGKSRSHWR